MSPDAGLGSPNHLRYRAIDGFIGGTNAQGVLCSYDAYQFKLWPIKELFTGIDRSVEAHEGDDRITTVICLALVMTAVIDSVHQTD